MNKLFAILTIGCVPILMVVCSTREDAPPVPHAADNVASAPTAHPSTHSSGRSAYGWYRVVSNPPMEVMVTHLTIPNVLERHEEKHGIARYGADLMPPEGCLGPMMHADGRNEKGGFGCNGGIFLPWAESDNSSVVLDVNYSWTTPDQVRGELKEKVKVKVGEARDVDLPSGARLEIQWEKRTEPAN